MEIHWNETVIGEVAWTDNIAGQAAYINKKHNPPKLYVHSIGHVETPPDATLEQIKQIAETWLKSQGEA